MAARAIDRNKCMGCGHSCCVRIIGNGVRVTHLDYRKALNAIAKALPVLEARGIFTDRLKVIAKQIKREMDRGGKRIFFLPKKAETDECIFFSDVGDKGCIVYEERPKMCHDYPLEAKRVGDKWKVSLVMDCPEAVFVLMDFLRREGLKNGDYDLALTGPDDKVKLFIARMKEAMASA